MSQSRYASIPTLTFTTPDGRQIPYLDRRLLPAPGALATLRLHLVKPGERIDLIAQTELGDPELSWLIADGNLVMKPSDLERAGQVIIIPLPSGTPGAASA